MNIPCRNNIIMHKRGYWTKEVVIQHFEDYISKNGNLPTTKTLDILGNFPKRKTIKSLFDMTYMKFCKTYFPDYYINDIPKYRRYDINVLVEDFKRQYEELGRPTMRDYDIRRRKGSPSVRTLLKISNKDFKEFAKYYNIKIPNDSTDLTQVKVDVVHLNKIDITEIQKYLE